jgi:hypothetical protein
VQQRHQRAGRSLCCAISVSMTRDGGGNVFLHAAFLGGNGVGIPAFHMPSMAQ